MVSLVRGVFYYTAVITTGVLMLAIVAQFGDHFARSATSALAYANGQTLIRVLLCGILYYWSHRAQATRPTVFASFTMTLGSFFTWWLDVYPGIRRPLTIACHNTESVTSDVHSCRVTQGGAWLSVFLMFALLPLLGASLRAAYRRWHAQALWSASSMFERVGLVCLFIIYFFMFLWACGGMASAGQANHPTAPMFSIETYCNWLASSITIVVSFATYALLAGWSIGSDGASLISASPRHGGEGQPSSYGSSSSSEERATGESDGSTSSVKPDTAVYMTSIGALSSWLLTFVVWVIWFYHLVHRYDYGTVSGTMYPADVLELVSFSFIALALFLLSVALLLLWRVRAAAVPDARRWPSGSTTGSARVEQVLIIVIVILIVILTCINIGGVSHSLSVSSGVGPAIINRFAALIVIIGLHLAAIFWYGRPSATSSPIPSIVLGWALFFLFWALVYPSLYSAYLAGAQSSCLAHGSICSTNKASAAFTMLVLVTWFWLIVTQHVRWTGQLTPVVKGSARWGFGCIVLALLGLFIYGAAWMRYSIYLGPVESVIQELVRVRDSWTIPAAIVLAASAHALLTHGQFDEEVALAPGDSTVDVSLVTVLANSVVVIIGWCTWLALAKDMTDCSSEEHCTAQRAMAAGAGLVILGLTFLSWVQHRILRQVGESVVATAADTDPQ